LEVRHSIIDDYMGVRATVSEAIDRGSTKLWVRPRHQRSGDFNPPLVERYAAIGLVEVNIGKDDIILEHEHAFDDTSEACRAFQMADLFSQFSKVA
jgi:hypothetical protein